MKFKVQQKKQPNIELYKKSDYDIASDFAKKVLLEFKEFIKSVVLFGSVSRHKHPEGDIDVLVVVDDTMLELTPEVVESYRIILEEIVAQVSLKLHITTLKMTHFWDFVRNGDPIAINILRDGVALYDTSFFVPLQILLRRGRIRPSEESIWTYYARAPNTIKNARWHVMQAVLDLYWAVVDAAHATLMRIGEIPPSPEHVADLLNEKLVRKKLLGKKYVDVVREFYKISKMIVYREVHDISGREYDRYRKAAEEFVDRMADFVEGRKFK
ncbi:hypothetical protein DRJ17_02950 [Candidatus Woesearchaeota archaeon]|nr:MAG: hypothetical protein DRJ17_02950 [Candidatus Woesearchaeota archaeon]